MDNLSGYAHRPLPFVLRYLRQRLAAHVVILIAVVAAVACSVSVALMFFPYFFSLFSS